LLIQQNVDSSNYFHQSWETFKDGFGSKSCNYWLGNELLHQLTKDGLYKVRFDLQSKESGNWYWAEYSTFVVDNEANWYNLNVSGYSGNAGDSMECINGVNFTTVDSDNDQGSMNCALRRGGGYWWKKCGHSHVTATKLRSGMLGHGWKKLPLETDKHLLTSRTWLMCP